MPLVTCLFVSKSHQRETHAEKNKSILSRMCARVANVHIRTYKNMCDACSYMQYVTWKVHALVMFGLWSVLKQPINVTAKIRFSTLSISLPLMDFFAVNLFTWSWGIVSYICAPPPQHCVCQSAQSYYIFQMQFSTSRAEDL